MKTRSLTKAALLSLFTVSVITAITLNSCQKENIKPKSANSTGKTNGVSNVTATSNLVMEEAGNILFSSSGSAKGLAMGAFDSSGCAVKTYDTINKPSTITYNFGSSCLGSDGKTRAGVVSLSYANRDIRVVNNNITATFQNYSINGTTINGTISLVNYGPNGNGNQVIAESGNIIAASQSETDTMIINYENEWLSGEFSSPASNWQFSVTGSIHGGTTNGQQADITITSALIKNAKNPTCSYYIQGTVQATEGTNATEYFDYGNPGGCSGQVAVTQNGTTTIKNQ